MSMSERNTRRTTWRRWLLRQLVWLGSGALFFLVINGLAWWRNSAGPEFGYLHNEGCRTIKAVAFSPDGKLLAAGGTAGPRGRSDVSVPSAIKVWDCNGKLTANIDEPAGEVTTLAFNPDGNALAWASHDGSVKLLDVATVTPGTSIHTGRVSRIDFLPDGGLLAASDSGLILWDIASGRVRRAYSTHKAICFAHCLATNRLAFATWDNQKRQEAVEICDAESAARIAVVEPIPSSNQYVNYVRSMAFSPSGDRLFVGMDQGLWSIDIKDNTIGKPQPIGNIAPVWAIVVSPDGGKVAVVGRPGPDLIYRGSVLDTSTWTGPALTFEMRSSIWHPFGHAYSFWAAKHTAWPSPRMDRAWHSAEKFRVDVWGFIK